ncbi:G-protein alpha subunit [Thelephora ganbajun]|uniref:G-protein alpha subunit n=1 Tax=Thelephora ganbajun TaxID=370292 RepID=A0ACB6ZPC6_THEGA|nr:G-protein alpha subunit [Thelephora ganbajun]
MKAVSKPRWANDPFAAALMPPSGETDDERAKRVHEQSEAARVSREIDESLQETKKLLEKRKKAIKVLLLGQAESGKSTTLKNFQLSFCPSQFKKERAAWRLIIQLNLIKSVRTILQAIQDDWEAIGPVKPTSPIPGFSRQNGSTTGPLLAPNNQETGDKEDREPILTDAHRRLRMRLSPLISMEENLNKKLFPHPPDPREISVRGGTNWKSYLTRLPREKEQKPLRPGSSQGSLPQEEGTRILVTFKEDIIALWSDPVVHRVLKRRRCNIRDMPGFFLDDVQRIAVQNYEPSDQDIMKARLKTVGVEEYHFVMENAPEGDGDWYIYDVGGSRSLRSQWASFFDDVQAIIFLAPLTFNLTLEEDPTVNRIEDSIIIWKAICSNRLLEHATIILFMNKMDVLATALGSGLRVRDYVTSYGDLPNDVPSVVKYFRDKFKAYHKKLSPKSRSFFWHETSVIDTDATSAILFGVREGILRSQLSKSNVI